MLCYDLFVLFHRQENKFSAIKKQFGYRMFWENYGRPFGRAVILHRRHLQRKALVATPHTVFFIFMPH
jgi:hypothetical protein